MSQWTSSANPGRSRKTRRSGSQSAMQVIHIKPIADAIRSYGEVDSTRDSNLEQGAEILSRRISHLLISLTT